MSLFIRAITVAKSAKTPEQARCAAKYVSLAGKEEIRQAMRGDYGDIGRSIKISDKYRSILRMLEEKKHV